VFSYQVYGSPTLHQFPHTSFPTVADSPLQLSHPNPPLFRQPFSPFHSIFYLFPMHFHLPRLHLSGFVISYGLLFEKFNFSSFFVIYSIFVMQIISVGGPSWRDNGYGNPNGNLFDGCQGESDHWSDLDTDLYHWTKALRPVQVRYLFMCLLIYMHCVLLHQCTIRSADILVGHGAVVSWSYCKSRKRTEGAAQIDGCCDRGAGWTNSYVHKSSTGKYLSFFFRNRKH